MHKIRQIKIKVLTKKIIIYQLIKRNNKHNHKNLLKQINKNKLLHKILNNNPLKNLHFQYNYCFLNK